MQNIPGFGGSQLDMKSKVEAANKSAGETPAKAAHAGIKQALTEAFGRPVGDTDISVSSERGKFRVVVAPTVVPAKQNMTIFGLTLPFQRIQPTTAIDAALANVNVGAKRRIFQRLFPSKRGTFHASKTFRNEEALMRFTLDCSQGLGNPPTEAQVKAKAEADGKANREADVKISSPSSQPTRPSVSPPAGLPGGLPGMPGGPGGLPGMPAGAPPRGPGAGLPGLGGMPPGGPGGLPGMPGGPGLGGMPN